MQSYRRIVSYLYRYTKEGKADNTGYVRVESRENQLKLQFRIRDLRMMDRRKLTVCLYFHTEEGLRPVYVDEFFCDRGSCEYKKSYPEKDYDFEQIKGVLFFDSEGLLYGSSWDDRPIREDKILEINKEKADAKEPEETMKAVEITEEEEKNPWNMKKISIDEIPKDYENLLSNVFLKEAYEQYGYLLLGNLKGKNEKEIWIIGVPGIYDNRKKYLAFLYGFPHYISEEETELKTGKKGYWIRKM